LKKKVDEILVAHPERQRLCDELFGCGPLSSLINDEEISEIIVNGAASIWLERRGRFFRHEDVFLSDFTLSQFVQLICAESRLKLDLNHPFADGMWRGLRVHLAQSPLVHLSHSLCLRRHPKQHWTLPAFQQRDWATEKDFVTLQSLLDERKNFLVIGPTGSGKTSVLSALLHALPQNERVVIIEDTSEIQIPNSFSTKLLARREGTGTLRGIDQAELVKQSLRMRPSRLVVGEVRGGEAKDLLLALSTGHSGSLGTLHAYSARQALLRLEMLVQLGAPEWSLETIRKLILLSLDALVVVEMKDGQRRLEGIYKICSLEKIGFLLEKL
jgi:pilus assembly protein CpaF